MREVVEKGADLGIAWDGDADRCFFIDEQGAFIDGDFLTALLAESMLEKQPKSTILYDVRASRAVADVVEGAGGRALMNRVGHAFFKTRMREEHAIFGGEVSGHYYFHDFYCADSGTIPALLMLELLSSRGAKPSELLEPYRRATSSPGRSTPRSTIRTPRSRSSPRATPTARQYRLDGLSVEYDDWHFNVRPSNTEPLLRLCLESLRSARGHGAPARRGARRDSFLSAPPQPAPSAEEALALAARAGIHRLAVPTPFLVGRVNCYLIEDRPLTLIDTGPNSGKSLDELERALAEHGHAIEDLELIVLTHQHMDHIGLLEILARRSGAEVAALSSLGPLPRELRQQRLGGRRVLAGDHAPSRDPLRHLDRARLRRGVVPSVRLKRQGDPTPPRRRRADVRRPDAAGSASTGAQPVGHDLLGRVPIDPDLRRPPARPHLVQPAGLAAARRRRRRRARPQALVQYIESMRATRELPARIVLTGHGEPVVDHVALIDERLRMHRRRARKLLRLLQSGPLTAYEIAVQIWGNVAVTQAYLTLSEVLGHLDVLANEGQVRESEDGDVVRFHAVPDH